MTATALDRHFPVVAGVAAFATYWATRATVPTEWDSVQLVMGLDRFDLRQDSPHAPGYWGYVAVGRAIRALTPLGSVTALTLASAIAAAVTVALVGVLGRELGGRWLGVASAAVVATTPFLWFYGSSVATYAYDALGSAALMLLAWRARPGAWHGVAAAAVLGLTGGFRQTSLIVLFPLALTACLRANRTARAWLASGAAGALALGAWFVPMLLEQPGGYAEIQHNDHFYWLNDARHTSVLSAGLSPAVQRSFKQLTASTVAAVGLVALLGAVALVVGASAPRRAPSARPPAPGLRLTPVELLLIAAVPPTAFITLFGFGKAGYVLAFLAPLVVLCLWPAARLDRRWRRTLGAVGVAVIALFGVQRFLFGAGVLPEQLLDRGPWFTRRANAAPFGVTRHTLRMVDAQQRVFDEIARRFDPGRDVLVYVEGNGGQYFRNAMWALPRFTIHYDDGSDALTGRGDQYERPADYEIDVPPDGDAVFVVDLPNAEMARLQARGLIRQIQLRAGPSVWVVPPGRRLWHVTVTAVPGALDRPIVVRSPKLP